MRQRKYRRHVTVNSPGIIIKHHLEGYLVRFLIVIYGKKLENKNGRYTQKYINKIIKLRFQRLYEAYKYFLVDNNSLIKIKSERKNLDHFMKHMDLIFQIFRYPSLIPYLYFGKNSLNRHDYLSKLRFTLRKIKRSWFTLLLCLNKKNLPRDMIEEISDKFNKVIAEFYYNCSSNIIYTDSD